MKVLFVASGNKKVGQVNSFVRSQFESLKAEGLDMHLFPVVGHGVRGYAKAVFALRKVIKQEQPDIIHAHYSVCGHVAVLACIGLRHKPKIVVSILGSFPTKSRKWRLVRYCIQNVWDATIVKSERTRNQLGLDLPVIPNGVNLDIFHPMDKEECKKHLDWRLDSANIDAAHLAETKYVIWCSNPERIEKNWTLAVEGVKELENEGIKAELIPVYDKTPQEVAVYMNAADCLLLTSWSEGSPNVIKEAMACNCPIVTTDVGDVTERLIGLEGCYVAITEHPITNQQTQDMYLEENGHEIAECLRKVLAFGERTEGRKRIIKDGLTIEQIAKRIMELYSKV